MKSYTLSQSPGLLLSRAAGPVVPTILAQPHHARDLLEALASLLPLGAARVVADSAAALGGAGVGAATTAAATTAPSAAVPQVGRCGGGNGSTATAVTAALLAYQLEKQVRSFIALCCPTYTY